MKHCVCNGKLYERCEPIGGLDGCSLCDLLDEDGSTCRHYDRANCGCAGGEYWKCIGNAARKSELGKTEKHINNALDRLDELRKELLWLRGAIQHERNK